MPQNWFPTIDIGRCKADCFICINFCPNKVFKKEKGLTVVAHPNKCIQGCDNCKKICPEKAISFITTRQIEIEGLKIGINGMDEAFEKFPDDFEKAFKKIEKNNYIPEGSKQIYKRTIRKEFEKFKSDK